jgi:mRNA-degrading endonuclease toxin of MazEF toxin-antitoxin module
LKGFSKQVCLVVPLTTSEKLNPYHFSLGKIRDRNSFAIISQIRLIDTRRLVDKVGMLNKEKFVALKKSVKEIL